MGVSLWRGQIHIVSLTHLLKAGLGVCLRGSHHSQVSCKEPEFPLLPPPGLTSTPRERALIFQSPALVPEVCIYVNLFLRGIVIYSIDL